MTEVKPVVDTDLHKKLAKDLFNSTWDLIEKPDRTQIEDLSMIHSAHASRYHWDMVGTPLNFARGEWQVSRVYAMVKRSEPALYHANQCVEISLTHQLGDFDIGFAYEALARAYAVQGDLSERDKYIALARQSAERITKDGDKKWLIKNIDTVETLALPKWE